MTAFQLTPVSSKSVIYQEEGLFDLEINPAMNFPLTVSLMKPVGDTWVWYNLPTPIQAEVLKAYGGERIFRPGVRVKISISIEE